MLDDKTRENLIKNHITPVAYRKRLERGWSKTRAQTEPLIECARKYKVSAPNDFPVLFLGTKRVAEWLSEQTRHTVTKNTIVGQLYRKGFATVGKFTVEPL